MAKTLLCFGYGYSARALARLLKPMGWRVTGTTRDAAKADAIAAGEAQPLVWPGGDAAPAMAAASHILVSAGPTAQGDPVLGRVRAELAARAGKLEWVGYLSTTGVYGDHQGGWVDESTPRNPGTERGRLRVAAEDDWMLLAKETGLPLHIFRLAGIYGPGRGPFAKVKNGTARRIIKANQVFSRIHVDDIAQILAASIAKPDPGAIYNVCDDDPAPPQDVIAYAAKLLELPPPPEMDFDAASLSPMARSFYAESKRVRNDKIKSELRVELQYPSYRSGLLALLNEE